MDDPCPRERLFVSVLMRMPAKRQPVALVTRRRLPYLLIDTGSICLMGPWGAIERMIPHIRIGPQTQVASRRRVMRFCLLAAAPGESSVQAATAATLLRTYMGAACA